MDKITVVIIEDHDLTRIGLRTTLKQHPAIEILGEARDGISGLGLIKATQPDVAIVDVGLPSMSGIELTQQLKQDQVEGNVQTKVLIMTMQDTEDTVLAAFAAGAESYCMKDSGSERLLEALQVTAEGNHWIDPAIARVVLHQSQKAYSEKEDIVTSNSVKIRGLAETETQIIHGLTDRELEVLSLIVDGCSNETIANKCYITVGTVKTHVRNILNKLCVDDRTQAAVRALRAGLVH